MAVEMTMASSVVVEKVRFMFELCCCVGVGEVEVEKIIN